jgi:hypothetical protein
VRIKATFAAVACVLAAIWTSVFAVGQTAAPTPSGFEAGQIRGETAERIAAAYRDGVTSWGEQNFEQAAQSLQRAYAVNPKDDAAVYLIAAAYAKVGNKQQALNWLQRLVTLRSCLQPGKQTFGGLEGLPEFASIQAALKANLPRPHPSQPAFTIPMKDIIPENIAYDPVTKVFYLGSLYRRQILRIKVKSNTVLSVENFTAEAQDGLYSVLGMKVDARRRVLWALSAVGTEMRGVSDALRGNTAVFKYSLNENKLIRKYALGPDPPHFFNDLVLNAAGDVFLTDSQSGEIYTIQHDEDKLEVLIPPGHFLNPNGTAISEDDRKLFVADSALGLYVIDLTTRKISRLGQPSGTTPFGIDGLYFHNSALIGIANGLGSGTIYRYPLNSALDEITRIEVLDSGDPRFATPTTGVVVGNVLYYLPNPGFLNFNAPGKLAPADQLSDVLVLKLRL